METPSPTAQLIPTLLIFSLIMFLGDWCYYTAYQKGGPGSLPAITTIVATMPVFATIIKSILERRLPTSSQFAGCLLAVLAVYCVSRK